jgi:hypothetical protein
VLDDVLFLAEDKGGKRLFALPVQVEKSFGTFF